MHMKQRFHIDVWCTIKDKWEMWLWHCEQLLLDWQFMKETETFLHLFQNWKGFVTLTFLRQFHQDHLSFWIVFTLGLFIID